MAVFMYQGKQFEAKKIEVGDLLVLPNAEVVQVQRIWASCPDEAEVVTAQVMGYELRAEDLPQNTKPALPV